MERNKEYSLSEQAPTGIFFVSFRMAELGNKNLTPFSKMRDDSLF